MDAARPSSPCPCFPTALGALVFARGARSARADAASLALRNPFDLRAALLRASPLSRALHVWLGTPGVYALATLSGVAEVDAIAIAALANTLAKAALAALLGGAALARAILLASLLAGALATALV